MPKEKRVDQPDKGLHRVCSPLLWGENVAKGKYAEWITKDGLLQIESFARDGLNDEQIAAKIGISAKTLYEWENRFSEIRKAIKRGKAPVDTTVENALLKSALGFTKTVRKAVKLRQRGGNEIVEYVEEEVYVPPQVTAQIFWLKNRRPDRWRDKPEIMADADQVNIIIDV